MVAPTESPTAINSQNTEIPTHAPTPPSLTSHPTSSTGTKNQSKTQSPSLHPIYANKIPEDPTIEFNDDLLPKNPQPSYSVKITVYLGWLCIVSAVVLVATL